MDSALSGIDHLLSTFDDDEKENEIDAEQSGNNELSQITNCNDIRCQQCNGILLHKGTASSITLTECIKIHGYKGKDFENVKEFWKVATLTSFESVSVSRAVSIGTQEETNNVISILADSVNIQN